MKNKLKKQFLYLIALSLYFLFAYVWPKTDRKTDDIFPSRQKEWRIHQQIKKPGLSISQEMHKKELFIQKQREKLNLYNWLLSRLVGIIIILFILLIITKKNYQIAQEKSWMVIRRMHELLHIYHELIHTSEINPSFIQKAKKRKTSGIPETSGTNNIVKEEPVYKFIFDRLHKRIVQEKLFLRTNLGRKELLKLTQLDRNRFARMIHENTGTNLAGYLNDMRLEESIRLMKEHPNHTLQAIAADAGIPQVRTFYRLFHKKMGMTPKTYKALLEKEEAIPNGTKSIMP